MSVWESIRTSITAIRVHPLRSFLTMLGIIIGVGAVIAMVAVGRGAQRQVADKIQRMGTNLLMVTPDAARSNGVRLKNGSSHTLTESDAMAIQKAILGVVDAAPAAIGEVQIVSGNRNWQTILAGTVPSYLKARDWPVEHGSVFSQSDVKAMRKVVVIGATIANALFESGDPLGHDVRINNVPFKVIGVLTKKGLSGTEKQDNIVFAPISTAKIRVLSGVHRVNREAVNAILLKASDSSLVERVRHETKLLLRHRHRLQQGYPDDFKIYEPAAALATQKEASKILLVLLGAVASIALIVGGISIMNIMLVSVTERTREIGIRLASGARPTDIRQQFLIEAIVLCALGGVLGVFVGVAAAVVLEKLTGWATFVGPEAPILALLATSAIGIFFGYYPASKAAQLNPMDALNYE